MTALIGREAELAGVERLLDRSAQGSSALLFEGDAGIGKTVLWREAIARARRKGYTVLQARPAQAEKDLAFAGLADLLAGVVESFSLLPEPQRRALRVALLLESASHPSPDDRAVATALLGFLRRLAATERVFVAVDDEQWLDAPSAQALRFALRRLDAEPVRVLAAARAAVRSVELERAERLVLGPLPLEGLDQLLRTRLGARFLRLVLLKIARASGGNPLYALELAQALLRRGVPLEPGEPLPVSDDLRSLIWARLGTLPREAREAVALAEAAGRPTIELLESALGGGGGIRSALACDALVEEGGRIRPSHPVVGSVAYSELGASARRQLHRRLAYVVAEPEERARHLAAAAEAPDERVAAVLDEAAARASLRGAHEIATDLAELAITSTPTSGGGSLHRRRLAAASYAATAGGVDRAVRLLEQALADAREGAARAEAELQLAEVRLLQGEAAEAETLGRQALRHAGGDPRLSAAALTVLANAVIRRRGVEEALSQAAEAVAYAEASGEPALLAEAVGVLTKAQSWAGRPPDLALLERAVELERRGRRYVRLHRRVSTGLSYELLWAGRFDEARPRLEELVRIGRSTGDPDVGQLLGALGAIAVLEGDWHRCLALCDEAAREARERGRDALEAPALWLSGYGHLAGGDVEAALAAAEAALEASSTPKDAAEAQGCLGAIHLVLGDSRQAVRCLEPAVATLRGLGLADPARLYPVPDYVEALTAAGATAAAEDVLAWYERCARSRDRRWALAAAGRCRGQILAAAGELGAAVDELARATRLYEQLGWRLDLGRTLLALGRTERRARRNRAARDTLTRALALFEELETQLWAEKAREELGRIAGRRPTPGRLTPTEQQVADLVAAGRSNADVARLLFMSPKTVEWNLTKVFRKVNVSSRGELAAKLAHRHT